MDLMMVLRLGMLLGTTSLANGYFEIPEGPACVNYVPYYELEKQSIDTPFYSDYSNQPDMQYLTSYSPSSRISRKKRSTEQDNESPGEDNVKTIHLPVPFTPRLGKRSDLEDILNEVMDGRSIEKDIAYRFQGDNGGAKKIQFLPGTHFTPRLGRANRIQLNPGFTPRLGRSDSRYAGDAFTPRLGKSEGPRMVQLPAIAGFTPRLGRSEPEGPKTIELNAGSSFTPRLGRSEGPRKIQLDLHFTPRLGRSDGSNRITNNAFTAPLRKSESPFKPRLG